MTGSLRRRLVLSLCGSMVTAWLATAYFTYFDTRSLIDEVTDEHLQQSAEISRAQYQTLLTRQRDLDTQAYLQVADSRIVAEATPPSSPSFPNPRLILALAGVVGVSLGIGFAFLMENVFGGFTSESLAM